MNQTRWGDTVRSNHVVVTGATANGGVAVAAVVGGVWVTWEVLVGCCHWSTPLTSQRLDLIDLPVKMRCSFQDRTGRKGQAPNKETFMFEEGVCVVCMVSRRCNNDVSTTVEVQRRKVLITKFRNLVKTKLLADRQQKNEDPFPIQLIQLWPWAQG